MRPLLISTFDLGETFGIADTAFKDGCARRPAALGDVSVDNPLGWGSTVILDPNGDVLTNWRAEAGAQVQRMAGEEALGWSDAVGEPQDVFVANVAELVRSHPVERCALTVYSVGVVSVHLQFGPGLPVQFCEGFLNCFEFAGYTPSVSDALSGVATQRRYQAAKAKTGPLEELTRRPAPGVRTDDKDYKESERFQYFRHVVLGVDPGDDVAVAALLAATTDEVTPVRFELHGWLHYSSGLLLFEANGLRTGADSNTMMRDAQRIIADIEITHVFAGVCSAYSSLILDAIRKQVDAYSGATPAGPDPQRLNRLRAISLAVVNLTQFDLISTTREDQEYFAVFEKEEKLEQKHRQISGAVEVLYSVQAADEQDQDARRSDRVNRVLQILTSLTVISVLVDSYNFVREDQPILPGLLFRAITLLLLLGLLLFLGVRTGKRG